VVGSAHGALVAAYDIGSNSIKLTVASVSPTGNVTEIHNDLATVRIGHDVDRTGLLAPDRVAAALEALSQFAEKAESFGATRSIGVATEAVRIAANGASFLEEIRSQFGIDVVTISGDREAELTYAGLATIRTLSGPICMVDIGGASTEIVHGMGDTIISARSIPLGSGRLTDTWIVADPPTWAEVAAVRVAASDRLAGVQFERALDTRLIISGGTGGYLSAWMNGDTTFDTPRIDAALARMGRLSAAELAPRIGAGPERARVLPAGVAIILAVIDRVGPATIETAPSGLRIGLLQAAAKGTL
jgi:exopolyphosphatase/guanosine-5'-triphosphate,3'-diphosphate pyrophosphatase